MATGNVVDQGSEGRGGWRNGYLTSQPFSRRQPPGHQTVAELSTQPSQPVTCPAKRRLGFAFKGVGS